MSSPSMETPQAAVTPQVGSTGRAVQDRIALLRAHAVAWLHAALAAPAIGAAAALPGAASGGGEWSGGSSAGQRKVSGGSSPPPPLQTSHVPGGAGPAGSGGVTRSPPLAPTTATPRLEPARGVDPAMMLGTLQELAAGDACLDTLPSSSASARGKRRSGTWGTAAGSSSDGAAREWSATVARLLRLRSLVVDRGMVDDVASAVVGAQEWHAFVREGGPPRIEPPTPSTAGGATRGEGVCQASSSSGAAATAQAPAGPAPLEAVGSSEGGAAVTGRKMSAPTPIGLQTFPGTPPLNPATPEFVPQSERMRRPLPSPSTPGGASQARASPAVAVAAVTTAPSVNVSGCGGSGSAAVAAGSTGSGSGSGVSPPGLRSYHLETREEMLTRHSLQQQQQQQQQQSPGLNPRGRNASFGAGGSLTQLSGSKSSFFGGSVSTPPPMFVPGTPPGGGSSRVTPRSSPMLGPSMLSQMGLHHGHQMFQLHPSALHPVAAAASSSSASSSSAAAAAAQSSGSGSHNRNGGAGLLGPTGKCLTALPPQLSQQQQQQQQQSSPPSSTSASSGCPWDFILVVDFEATCEEPNPPSYYHEIIEFPVVVVDVSARQIIAEFQSFVRPVKNPTLTPFCTSLTGIMQRDVDAAPTLQEVVDKFDRWFRNTIPPTARCVVATDGPWDMRDFMFNYSVRLGGVAFPQLFFKWVDVKHTFAQFFGCQRGKIRAMLEALGIPFEGRLHSGIDDSRNIAKIVIGMLRRGCTFEAVDSIPYAGPPASIDNTQS